MFKSCFWRYFCQFLLRPTNIFRFIIVSRYFVFFFLFYYTLRPKCAVVSSSPWKQARSSWKINTVCRMIWVRVRTFSESDLRSNKKPVEISTQCWNHFKPKFNLASKSSQTLQLTDLKHHKRHKITVNCKRVDETVNVSYQIAFQSKADHSRMRALSCAWSLPVTW